ncbi:MAG: metal-dependent hydrolase [Lentisphaerae bacterium]|nr:metal-dependent hydrolase [Lentisphaerota bacterium]
MDSLTQATLGAAVGHACWNRQLGRRALLWGAVLGTLPDLDVVLYPVLDDVQRLYWHRGESHSIGFAVLGGLLLARLLWTHRWKTALPFRRAVLGVWLILLTHLLIDYFTIYGTQLLAPFSRYGFGLGNLFIIDPFYTVPLLGGVAAAAVLGGPAGRRAVTTGLVVSTLYILFSLGSHAYADRVFQSRLAHRNVTVLKSLTGATPFNTLLWRHAALTPEGVLIGYFSVIGNRPGDAVRFERVPRNEHLLAPYRGQRNVAAVTWFSKGFWSAAETNGVVTVSDLRFGEFRDTPGAPPETWHHAFSWTITGDPDALPTQSGVPRDTRAALAVLWNRLRGAAD